MNAGFDPITLRKIALQVLILLSVLFGAIAWSQRPDRVHLTPFLIFGIVGCIFF